MTVGRCHTRSPANVVGFVPPVAWRRRLASSDVRATSEGDTLPHTTVIDDAAKAGPFLDEWDALAERLAQPYAAPAWMLAWWRHLGAGDARLAIVVVREGGRVIGIAPCFSRTVRGLPTVHLLGTGHRVEPLAHPGFEAIVAEGIRDALQEIQPRPGAISLDVADAGSPWPALLSRGRPRPSRLVVLGTTSAPTLHTGGGTYEDWLESRTSSFRAKRRRGRRELSRAGAHPRLIVSADDIDPALDALIDLHVARWAPRRATALSQSGMRRMLGDAAHDLLPRGRMRIWVLESAGRPICVQLFVTAGGETALWNGGFDEAWSRLSPGLETLVFAVEHAFAMGDRRIDFGGGPSLYKSRLATQDDPIQHAVILRGGAGRCIRSAQVLPDRITAGVTRVARRLPSGVQRPLKRLRSGVAWRR